MSPELKTAIDDLAHTAGISSNELVCRATETYVHSIQSVSDPAQILNSMRVSYSSALTAAASPIAFAAADPHDHLQNTIDQLAGKDNDVD